MSPVGHSLTGLSLAVCALPATEGRRKYILLPIFIALANLPDWPLPGWGHDRYEISHSAVVNLLLMIIAVLVWKFASLDRWLTVDVLLLGACAWLSHLLLDSFYGHGQGLAVLWPVSDGRLNLPIPIFRTIDQSVPLTSGRNLSVYAVEFLVYAPLVAAAVLLRVRRSRRVTDTAGP